MPALHPWCTPGNSSIRHNTCPCFACGWHREWAVKSQRPAGLPILTSQSALRQSISTSLWVSSSQRDARRVAPPQDHPRPTGATESEDPVLDSRTHIRELPPGLVDTLPKARNRLRLAVKRLSPQQTPHNKRQLLLCPIVNVRLRADIWG